MTDSFSTTVKNSDIHQKIAGANPLHAKTNINNLLRDSILGKYRTQMLNFKVEYEEKIDSFKITFVPDSTFDSTKQHDIVKMVKEYLKDPNKGIQ